MATSPGLADGEQGDVWGTNQMEAAPMESITAWVPQIKKKGPDSCFSGSALQTLQQQNPTVLHLS